MRAVNPSRARGKDSRGGVKDSATAVQAGVPLYEVQKVVGHSTPLMTERYAHLQPQHHQGARVWEVDVLECPRCQNRLRVLAAIHPPQATRAFLECLGLPSRAPPIAPARPDPPDPEEFAADWREPAGPAA